MKNHNDLKMDQIQARKNKEPIKATFMSTLIGEVDLELKRNIKSDPDEVLIKVATKFKKNIQQTIDVSGSTPNLIMELTLVEYYLPKVLDESEVRHYVEALVNEHGKDMRKIMPELKTIQGMDMKLASQILKGM